MHINKSQDLIFVITIICIAYSADMEERQEQAFGEKEEEELMAVVLVKLRVLRE